MTLNIPVRLYEAPIAAPVRPCILHLKLDHIGDFVTAQRAFQLLRNAYRDAEITLFCLPLMVDFATASGLFDRVHGFAGIAASSAGGLSPGPAIDDRLSTFDGLLDGEYWLAADFCHESHGTDWLARVPARLRAGFATMDRGLDIGLPGMEWNLRPAALAGGNGPVPLPLQAATRLTLLAYAIIETLPPTAATASHPAMKPARSDGRLHIGISLGAGSPLRQWPAAYWTALVRRLIATGHSVTIFGGPGDRAAAAALMNEVGSPDLVDETDRHSLAALPDVMRGLDGYIGCDTGLTHLAASLGLPTVDIFAGVSTVPVWRAHGPRVKTVYAEVECAPCHLRHAPDCPNGQICMKVIHPGIVEDCLRQSLAMN